MKVFVINLDKDVERLSHVSEQLAKAGMPFERVQGVYGKELSEIEMRRDYNDRRAKWNNARSLTRAEIGCSLSHIKTFKSIVGRGFPQALILEDDVLVPEDLGNLLGALIPHLPEHEPIVCLLSPSVPGSDQWIDLNNGQHQVASYADGFYTSSYIVTRAAAAALLKEFHPVSYVADSWRRLSELGIVKIVVTVPAVIVQDQTTFGSHTTEDVKKAFSNSFIKILAYKMRRIRNVIWDLVYIPWRKRKRS